MGANRDSDDTTIFPSEAMSEAEATEALAELLGDKLPPDWREPAAVAGRQECLAAAAYAAADAALELVIIRVDLRRQGGVDTPELQRFLDELLDLDHAWRAYVHDTQRGDAGIIVFEAAEYWAGATIATLVEGALMGVQAERRAQLAKQIK